MCRHATWIASELIKKEKIELIEVFDSKKDVIRNILKFSSRNENYIDLLDSSLRMTTLTRQVLPFFFFLTYNQSCIKMILL